MQYVPIRMHQVLITGTQFKRCALFNCTLDYLQLYQDKGNLSQSLCRKLPFAWPF